jgi:hypothetical protein
MFFLPRQVPLPKLGLPINLPTMSRERPVLKRLNGTAGYRGILKQRVTI